MKKYILIFLILCSYNLYSQANGLIISDTGGDPDINESAILELISNDKGILIPRLTTIQRDAITVGATQNGLVIFNTDEGKFQYYLHSLPGWVTIVPNGLSGTGNSNQVAFFVGGNNSTSLSGDSGLFYNPSNTFLGIGTENPQFALDVNGAARVGGPSTSGTIILNSDQIPTDYQAILLANPNSTEDVIFTFPPDNGTTGFSLVTDGQGNLSWSDSPEISQDAINTAGTQGGILFNNSGTMTTSNGIVVDNSSTFLGIGTDSPSQALDVANGYIKTGDADNNDGGLLIENSSSSFTSWLLASEPMTESVTFTLPPNNGTNGSYLTTDGSGNLVWTDPDSQSDFVMDAGGAATQLAVFEGSNTINGSALYYDSSNSFLGIGVPNPTQALDVAGTVNSTSMNTGSLTASGTVSGDTGIFNNLTATSATIDNLRSNTFTLTGTNADIIFIVPDGLTTDVTMSFPIDAGQSGQFLQTDGSGSLTWADPVLENSSITITNGTDGGLMYNNSGTLTNFDGVVIDASNTFLGIGTTTPEQALDVANGYIKTGDADNNDGGLLIENSSSSFTSWLLASEPMTESVTFTLPPNNGTNGSYLTTDGSGNLVWTDPDSQTDFVMDAGGAATQLAVFEGSNTINGSALFYDSSNSFLGIGIPNPTQALDVAGNILSSGTVSAVTGSFTNLEATNLTATSGTISNLTSNTFTLTGTNADIIFVVPDGLTTDVTMSFPIDAGQSGQFLQTDGSGSLTWADPVLENSSITITNGTDGGLMYNNSGTLTNFDGIVIDASNTFLGIGTLTPEQALDVANGYIKTGDADNNDGGLLIENSSSSFTSWLLASEPMTESVTFTLPPNNGTNGSYLTTDGSGNLVWTDPDSQTDFVMDAGGAATQLAVFEGSNTINGSALYYDSSNSFLGIGVPNPTQALDVAGNILSSGTVSAVTGSFTNITASNGTITNLATNTFTLTGTNADIIFIVPDGLSSDVTMSFPIDAGQSGQFLQTDGSGSLTWADPVLENSSITITNGTDGGLMYNNSGTLTNFDGIVIDASNTFLGIGTLTPEQALDVANGYIKTGDADNNDGGLLIENSSSSFTSWLLASEPMTESVTFTLPPNNGTNGSYLTTDGSGNLVWTDPDSQTDFVMDAGGAATQLAVFEGSNTINGSALYYDSSNSFLGIGVPNPTQALDVAGNILSSGTVSAVTGSFTNITASNGTITNLATNTFTLTGTNANIIFVVPDGLTTDVTMSFPIDAGQSGQFLQTDGSGSLTWADPVLENSSITITNGTDGGIMYNNSGTLTNFDGIVIDASNTFLGIGTLTPEQALDVANGYIKTGDADNNDGGLLIENSSSSFTSWLLASEPMTESVTFTLPPNNGTNGSYLTTDGSGNLVWTDPDSQTDFVVDAGGVATQLAVFEGSNTINGSALYYDSSNSFLGIGVPNPTQALDVAGNILSSGTVSAVTGSFTNIETDGFSATNATFTNLEATNLTATSGTISNLTSNTFTLEGTNADIIFIVPDGLSTDVTMSFPIDAGQSGQFLQTDGSGSLTWADPVLENSSITITNGTDGGLMYNNSGTLTNFDGIVIDASNTFLGIGTLTPEQALDVANGYIKTGDADNNDGGLLIENSSSSFTSWILASEPMTESVTFTLPPNNGTNGSYLTTDGSGNLVWTDPDSQTDFVMDAGGAATQLAVFEGSNTINGSALYYDSSNSFLGIGVPNPTQALDVAGNVLSSGTVSAVTGSLTNITASNGTITNLATNTFTLTGTSADIIMYVPDGLVTDITLSFPIDDGDAGQFLQTDGDGNLSWETVSSTFNSESILINNGTDGGIMYNNSGTLTNFDGITLDNSTTFMGIGTTSPEQALDVANGYIKTGDADNNDGGLLIENSSSSFTSWLLASEPMTESVTFTLPPNNGTNGSYLTTDGSGNLVWTDPDSQTDFVMDAGGAATQLAVFEGSNTINGSALFYDSSNSFLGIGIPNPTQALDVAGTVNSTSMSTGSLTASGTVTGDTGIFNNLTATSGTIGNLTSNTFTLTGTNADIIFVVPDGLTTDVTMSFPIDAGQSGQFLQTDGSGSLTWADPVLENSSITITNGTDGGIMYNNSGTLTNFDGIVIDASNTFLGIGTLTPEQALDVANGYIKTGDADNNDGGLLIENSSSSFTSWLLASEPMTESVTFTLPPNNGTNGSYLTTDGSGNLVWTDPDSQTDFVVDAGGAATQLAVFEGSNTINGSALYYDSSNSFLGIGVPNPTQALDVAGNILSSGTVSAVTGSFTNIETDGFSATNATFTNLETTNLTASNGTITSLESTSVIASSGTITNLESTNLIATSGTISNLQSNTFTLEGANGTLNFVADGQVGDVTLTFPIDAGLDGQYLQTDGNGSLTWSTLSSTISSDNILVENGTDGGLMYNNSGTLTNFDGIVIDASNTFLGIGTLTPEQALDVANGYIKTGDADNNDGGLLIENSSSSFTSWLLASEPMSESVTFTLPPNNGTNGSYLTTDGSGNLVWTDPDSQTDFVMDAGGAATQLAVFEGSNTINGSALYYDSSNSFLGIGVPNPTQALDVAGNVLSSGTVSAVTGSFTNLEATNLTATSGTIGNLTSNTFTLEGTNADIIFVVPDGLTTDVTMSFPIDAGQSGQFLQTDGSGSLTWADPVLENSSITITNGTDGGLMYNNSGTLTNFDGIVIDASNTFLGIGTLSPEQALDVANGYIKTGDADNNDGGLLIENSSSSFTSWILASEPMTESVTFTLPPNNGTNGSYLTTDGSGNLVWTDPDSQTDFVVDAGGAATQLAVFEGSNTINGSALYYDSSNSFLGIGVPNPTQALDVAGNVLSSGTVSAVTGSFTNIETDGFSATNATFTNLETTNLTATSGTISNLQSNTFTLTGTNADIIFVVPDGLTTDVTMSFPIDAGQSGQFLQTDGSGSLTWADPVLENSSITITNGTDGGLMYNNSGTLTNFDGIVIDASNTFLGIGTLTPEQALDVANGYIKTGDADNNDGGLLIENSSSSFTSWLLASEPMTESVTFTLPPNNGTNGSYLTTDGSGNLVWTDPDSQTDFVVDAGGAATQLAVFEGSNTINGSALYYDSSNSFLGIGVPNPTQALEVAGTVNSTSMSTGSLTASGTVTGDTGIFNNLTATSGTIGNLTSNTFTLTGTNANIIFVVPDGLTTDVTMSFPIDAGQSGQFLQTDGSGSLTWADPVLENSSITITNGTDGGLMYNNSGTLTNFDGIVIDASNTFLGIGTLTPEQALDVANGYIKTGDADNNDGGLLIENSSSSFTSWLLASEPMTESVTFTLPPNNGTNGSYLTTDGSGNLVWTDPDSQTDFVVDAGGAATQLAVFEGSNTINGSALYYDSSNSFLGIGVPNPTQALDVAGNILSSGTVSAVTGSFTNIETDGFSATNATFTNLETTNLTASNGTITSLESTSVIVSSGTITNFESTNLIATSGTISNLQSNTFTLEGTNGTLNFVADGQVGDVTLTFPIDAGLNGQYLQTDGNGSLTWSTLSSTISSDNILVENGTDGGLMYNNSGTLTNFDGIVIDASNTFLGIGTLTPEQALDVANGYIKTGDADNNDGGLLIENSSSSFTSWLLASEPMTESVTFTLPPNNGTNGSYLTTDGSGNLVWTDPDSQTDFVMDAGGAATQLAVFEGSNTINGSALYYDSSNSFLGIGVPNPTQALDVAGNVLSSGTVSAVTGSLTNITASNGTITNLATNTFTLTGTNADIIMYVPDGLVTDITLSFPIDDGDAGQFLQTDGDGNLSWETVSSTFNSESILINNGTDGGIMYNNSGTLTNFDGITLDNSTTFMGIGTTSPEQALDVANGYIKTGDADNNDGGLLIENSSSSFTSWLLASEPMTESVTFTLPPNNGTNGSYLTTDGSGNLVWTDPDSQTDFVMDAGGAATQLAVFEGSNTINGSALFYDSSNSFLGIGIPNPTQALDVAGTVNSTSISTGSLTASGTVSGDTGIFNNLTATSGTIGNLTSNTFTLTGTNADIIMYVPDGLVTDITLSFPIDDGDAGQFLQTDGDGNLSWETVSSTFNSESILINNGTDGGIMYNNSGTLTNFDGITLDNSTTFMGIGTTSPEQALDVANGYIKTGDASNNDGGVLIENATNANTLWLLSNTGMTESVTMTFPTSNGTNGSYLTTDGSGNLVWTDPDSQTDFVVDAGGAATQLAVFEGSNTINGSALFYDSSNSFLGIGVPNPTQALDVAGTVNSTSISTGSLTASGTVTGDTGVFDNLNVGSSGNAGVIRIDDGSGNDLIFQTPSGMSGDITFTMPNSNGTNGQVLSTDGSGNLSWTTGGSTTYSSDDILINNGTDGGLMYNNSGTLTNFDGIVIDASNTFLGIGTASPEQALDVANGYIKTGDASNNDGGVLIENATNANTLWLLSNTGMTESVTMTFPTSNGTNGSYLTTDGSGNLVWTDPGSQTDFVVDAGGAATQLAVFEGSNTINGSALFYDSSNSFLGIGVPNPTQALDVAGTVNSTSMSTGSLTASGTVTGDTGVFDNLNVGSSGNAGVIRIDDGSGNNLIMQTPSGMSGDITFTMPSTNGTNGQVLTTGGNGSLSWTTIAGGTGSVDTDGNGAADRVALWTNSSTLTGVAELFYNTTTNRLGVNNSSPSYTLDVGGDARFGKDGTSGSITLHSEQGGTDYNFSLTPSNTMTSDLSFTLPGEDGSNRDVLATNGSGELYWKAGGATIYGTTSTAGIATNQNNYVFDFDNTVLRFNATSNINLTGISATGAVDGQKIIIISVGTNRVRIQEENTNSTEANRFITGIGNVDLFTNGVATFIYDGTSQRWRLISTN